ncbi:MAG: ATP-binding protein [Tannerella sp.]|jgi:hypothetical protein|nr:ATP-binding protein [Tannerella sp.]
MKNLPIGTQSFEVLRSQDLLYVDKTELIFQLITTGRIYFLSRPRRFGKSMLISTLDALFNGHKELFEGLYIDDKWDWSNSNPFIRIDWTAIKHDTPEEIERSLSVRLKIKARENEITLFSEYVPDCFRELITELHRKTGEKVVVLIDEYDAPILDVMSKSPAALKAIQESLQSFYKILKATDEHLQFVFLTGVSKFAKLSIFSALNSLDDITMDESYAAICGYTQEELEYYFSERIDAMVTKDGDTRENLPDHIRQKYYHPLFLSWMNVLGFKAQGEVLTGQGRIDAVLEQTDTVVVCELKYHSKTKTATLLLHVIKQIHDKNYPQISIRRFPTVGTGSRSFRQGVPTWGQTPGRESINALMDILGLLREISRQRQKDRPARAWHSPERKSDAGWTF